MSELARASDPDVVAFGDVVQLSKERSKDPQADGFERYIGLEHLDPGDLKVRRWGHLSDGVTFTNVFRPGQVLFGKRRAYQRKVAVADFSGVCSGDIYVLEPKCDQLLPGLLPFICQSEPFYDYVMSMSQGGLSPRVNWTALMEYDLPLPLIDEQRRALALLDAARELQESAFQVATHAKSVWRASLEALWSDQRLPVCELGALLHDIVAGKSLPGAGTPPNADEFGVLKVSAVDPYGFQPLESKVISDQTAFRPEHQVRAGDFLMTRANTSALVGETCIVDRDFPNLMASDKTLRLEVKANVNKRLLWNLMQSRTMRRQISSVATGTGGAMKNISQPKIESLELPYPADESLARSFATSLDGAFRAATAAATREESARRVARVILDKAIGSANR